MANDTFQNDTLIRDFYGGTFPTREILVAALKAMKIVAAVDGVSPAEKAAMRHAMTTFGIVQDIQDEIMAFETEGVDVREAFPQLEPGSMQARWMLYNAVMVASADGFSDKERAMFRRVGDMLGIDQDIVEAIADLFALEQSVTRLRHSLFGAGRAGAA